MRVKVLVFIAPLLLVALAGAQTPVSPAVSAEELAEAAQLDAEVVNLFGRGLYDEAAPKAERVLEIKLKAYGAAHPGVADAQYNVGMIRVGQGRFAEAEAILRQALAVYEKTARATDPAPARVLKGLALVRAKLGHTEEALTLSLAALAAAEKIFGPEGKEVADYSRQLADIYRLKKERGKAETYYLRAIEIWAKTAGREDARVEMAVEGVMCMPGVDPRKVGRRIEEVLAAIDPVEGNVLNGKIVSKPQPEYPVAAKYKHIMGSVVIRVWVDETGIVERLQPVCGDPILAKASVEAARKARFSTTLLDGKPVKVSGYITYTFVLQ
jgi:TonB family protein